MLFKKFDYLNVLPLTIFIKRSSLSSQIKKMINHNGKVPSHINKLYHTNRLNSALISSITAKKEKYISLGIVSKEKVLSVLAVPPYNKTEYDKASNTSNMLINILQIKGRVMIGDLALHYYYNGGEYIDLAKKWYERYKLPFVFALLCYHHRDIKFENLLKEFKTNKVKIPRYILIKESKKRGFTPNQVTNYLNHIYYNIGYKEKKSLKKFYSLSKEYRSI